MTHILEPLWRQTEQLKPLQKLLLCRSVWLLLLWGYLGSEWLLGTPWQYLSKTVYISAIASAAHIFGCITWWRVTNPNVLVQTTQITFELLLMTALLAVNGGATNAFVSALILPVVFAAVSLSLPYIVAFTAASIGAYTWLIYQMPKMMVMHEMDMTEHYHGMWVSFLLSVVVIAMVVGTMTKMIAERERAIAHQREAQLRQEQLLALGTASAQVTHNIATPLATMQLLHEELQELHPHDPAIQELAEPLLQCRHHLDYFRQLATEIREGQITWQPVSTLINQLQEAVLLHFPDQKLALSTVPNGTLQADGMLLPALLNLVQNAVHANAINSCNQLELVLLPSENEISIELRDFGKGIAPEKLQALGADLVNSNNGLGIAVMLSNTTLERLGGSLTLANHPHQGALAQVTLPYRAQA